MKNVRTPQVGEGGLTHTVDRADRTLTRTITNERTKTKILSTKTA